MTDKPTFVSRDMMTADEGYVQWMADIKQRFRQSQLKAAVRVNTAMLELYWSVGSERVSNRQQAVDEIRHQAGDEKSHQLGGQLEVLEKGQQPADELEGEKKVSRLLTSTSHSAYPLTNLSRWWRGQ